MKILWLGGICWNEKGNYKYPPTTAGAISGSFFQQSIIEGIEELDKNIEITLLTEYCSQFKKNIPGFFWSHNGTSNDISVRVLQIPFFNRISKIINLEKMFLKHFKDKKFDFVVIYNIHSPYLKVLKKIKRTQPNIKSILIVPDLIEFTDVDLNKKPIKRILKYVDKYIINKLYRLIDGFVLFTESMKEKLPINEKPYVVVEGVFSSHGLKIAEVKKKRAIMYAGSLPFGFGIENIIRAMELLKDLDIQFWIFGNGPMKNYLSNIENRNKNIKYYGFVTREELFKYELEASILINARNPEDEFTKYSFPSKTFEFLFSETPFLTTKLLGIPKEYNNYLFLLDDNSPDEIAKKIKEIISMDCKVRKEKCLAARKFVENEKNKYVQSNKILNLIYKLQND